MKTKNGVICIHTTDDWYYTVDKEEYVKNTIHVEDIELRTDRTFLVRFQKDDPSDMVIYPAGIKRVFFER